MTMSNISVSSPTATCPVTGLGDADAELSIKNLLHRSELHVDPSGYFRGLREHDPVRWDPHLRAWLVTSYEDSLSMLRDPRVGAMPCVSLESARARGGAVAERFYHLLSKNILFMNPPLHTRVRKLVNAGFKQSVLQNMRTTVAELANQLLDEVEADGHMDVISVLARPIPAVVIARLLGAPEGDHRLFREWGDAAVELLQLVNLDDERFPELLRKGIAYYDYVTELVARRRREPNDGFLSELIAAVDEDPELDDDDLIANSRALLTGGHQTTTEAIGSGIYALLKHPEQLALLRKDMTLMPAAVEEVLRFHSPVVLHPRRAMEDITLHGKTLKRGDIIYSVPAAANRDPDAFPDPDRFDIARAKRNHLAFGQSIHFCVGAPLARIELEETFAAVLNRFPRLALESEPEWFLHFPLRGVNALHVSF